MAAVDSHLSYILRLFGDERLVEKPSRKARSPLRRAGPKNRLKGQNNRCYRRLRGRGRRYLMNPLRRYKNSNANSNESCL